MAKDKKQFILPQSKYLHNHADKDFVLVAMPKDLVEGIDRLRDAIVEYMPGYDEKDFKFLRIALSWVENIENITCVKYVQNKT